MVDVDVLTVAIGIGLAISLIFSELFGLAAGGMVVPGYLALSLDRPIDLALTLLASILTWAIVHAISSYVIVYGKRRTVLMILIGFLIGIGSRMIPLDFVLPPIEANSLLIPDRHTEYHTIGYIIPGLLAIWIDRQGLVETLSIALTAATAVRMVLIICGLEGLEY
ncbi:poly-gamma-glutamate biosynthesis protein PgsC [Calycomorphotria hydatis]|uniref:Capsule biosynthesis protein CapC n=1 Tax=Calycomorphotria hydatis TaxID=2528027 RepID=A0A517T737_9PLAN|nr:poly-gamma-glutamate biosynthesis protein PgsC [Calycomorphotria hydatis]QDT64170.1 Capsule biosynthesis protein CapC [Calycomorphotria hydatis]